MSTVGRCRRRSRWRSFPSEWELLFEKAGAGAPARQDPDPFHGVDRELLVAATTDVGAAGRSLQVEGDRKVVQLRPLGDHVLDDPAIVLRRQNGDRTDGTADVESV